MQLFSLAHSARVRQRATQHVFVIPSNFCVWRQKPFAVGCGREPNQVIFQTPSKHVLKSKVRFFVKTYGNTSFSDIVDLRLQGLRLCIMESKESCVFCNTEQSVKNMRRHITLYCDKARAECPGGDLLQEWERRTAKRKGFGNMLLFARKTPKRSDLTV